jgi:hypothetical protein
MSDSNSVGVRKVQEGVSEGDKEIEEMKGDYLFFIPISQISPYLPS